MIGYTRKSLSALALQCGRRDRFSLGIREDATRGSGVPPLRLHSRGARRTKNGEGCESQSERRPERALAGPPTETADRVPRARTGLLSYSGPKVVLFAWLRSHFRCLSFFGGQSHIYWLSFLDGIDSVSKRRSFQMGSIPL